MKTKLVVTLIALAAEPAWAQPVEHPAPAAPTPASSPLELSVAVSSTGGELDPAAVRTALAAELGIAIVEPGAFAPTAGRLEISAGDGMLVITYWPAEGSAVERKLTLPATPEDRLQLIEFVATNLVRDQVSALLASLAAPPPVVPAPIIVIPPAPVAATPQRPVVHHMVATIGLIPPLSLDRIAGERVVVDFGLNAVVGMTDASTVASISGAADIQRRYVSGLQIGGAAAVSGGTVDGLQIGGAGAVARGRVHGGQIGGAVAIAGGPVDGLQIGGAGAVAGGRVHGIQIGGAGAVSGGLVDGAQIGGAVSVAREVRGLQIAGAANIAGDVTGAQIGTINVARRMRGLQLGVVNISDDGDDAYPIGLINWAKNGRVSVDGWVESTKLSAAALRFGPKHIHNLFAVGWTPDHDHVLAGFGLGLHADLAATSSSGQAGPRGSMTQGRSLGFDLDAMNWWTDLYDRQLEQLNQLRASVSVPLGSFDVFAGAAANVYVTDKMDDSDNFHPFIARRVTSDTGVHVVTWPSVFAGVRMFVR